MVDPKLVISEDVGFTKLTLRSPDLTEYPLSVANGGLLQTGGASSYPIDSVFGRTGAVIAVAGDYDETLGGTGQTSYATGDLLYASALNTLSKLSAGADSQVLTLSGGVPIWAAASGSSPLTTKGDLYTYDTTDARLPVGTDGYILSADSAQTTGLNWIALPSAPVTSVFGRTGVVVAATNDYTWAQIDKATSSLSDVATYEIGDGTNKTVFSSAGVQTMEGTARVKKTLNFYAYNIGGLSGTYNGISCNASGLASLNGFYFKSFDDGGGAAIAEAANLSIQLPNDYVDGTDIEVEFGMALPTNGTNDVRWQCGATAVSETDTYSPSTYTWATPQNVAGPGTTWERKLVKFTLSGTGWVKEDDVSIVIFRDADNAADNYASPAYIPVVEIYYVADRIGGATV